MTRVRILNRIGRKGYAAGQAWEPLGWTLLGLLVFAAYYLGFNSGLPNFWPDSYEYAQAARNLALGRGLVTSSPTVLEYWLLSRFTMPLPYFFHDPGISILLAAFFRVFGISDAVVGWTSGLCYILTVPVTFVLGRKLFDVNVARLATWLTLVNYPLLSYSITGLSEVPYALFLTLLFLLLYSAPTRRSALLGGIVYGVLTVLRSNSLPFLPLILITIVLLRRAGNGGVIQSERDQLPSRRPGQASVISTLLLFLAGFGILYVPNAARYYSLSGSPIYNGTSYYALVYYTPAMTGTLNSVYASPGLAVEPLQFALAHPADMLNKVQYQLARNVPLLLRGGIVETPTWIDGFEIILFVGSFLLVFGETSRQRIFHGFILACLLLALLVGSLTLLRWRHLYGFIPIMLIYDAAVLVHAVRRVVGWFLPKRVGLSEWSAVPLAIAAVGCAAWLAPSGLLHDPRPAQSLSAYFEQAAAFVRAQTPPSAVIVTQLKPDSGGFQAGISWYADRELVQYHEYTLQTEVARSEARPLFCLMAADDSQAARSLRAKLRALGFKTVAQWHDPSGKVALILWQRS